MVLQLHVTTIPQSSLSKYFSLEVAYEIYLAQKTVEACLNRHDASVGEIFIRLGLLESLTFYFFFLSFHYCIVFFFFCILLILFIECVQNAHLMCHKCVSLSPSPCFLPVLVRLLGRCAMLVTRWMCFALSVVRGSVC